MSSRQAPVLLASLVRRAWVKKLVVLVAVAAVFGWLYGRLSSRLFPVDTKFGFAYGVLHGAVMPLALPTLLEGKDVELFGASNTGRGYKIGYICGINMCGLIFFGSVFWKPRRNSSHPDQALDVRTHMNQPRKISTTSSGPPAQ